MPPAISAKNGLCRSLSSTPTVRVRRLARLRAMAFGRYPSAAAAASTRSRRCGLTFGLSRMTSETSARDTPASRATSSMVGGPAGEALTAVGSWSMIPPLR
jgi:hypothetical protein